MLELLRNGLTRITTSQGPEELQKKHGEEDQEDVLLSRDQKGQVAPADAGSFSNVNPSEDEPYLVASESKDPVLHRLPHTEGLRCLDKSATIDPCQNLQELVRKWKLCTVTQVEENKVLLRLFPILATFLIFGVVLQLGNSLFLVQGGTLDNQLSQHTVVPLTALLAVSGLSDLATTQFLLPLLNRVLKLDKGIPPKVKIAIGLFISILCCITAAEVEAHRLKVVEKNDLINDPYEIVPMSIFWLFPRFILLGVIDGFAGDGLEDFFDDHVPSIMRIYKHLSSESVFCAGSLLSALLVVIAAETSKLTGRRSWFKDSVNTSRLNYFYWLIAILGVINLLCYVFVAVKCSPKKF
ncbi:protein NRT1/ PTR FAMILY 5.4-like [Aristolochia californica]|uniref:protein NRT1/ PTR FAMILY 5.4-like n=1 Tax=Aristolochia californica TaxID=171875 RepID=UPI0035D5F449